MDVSSDTVGPVPRKREASFSFPKLWPLYLAIHGQAIPSVFGHFDSAETGCSVTLTVPYHMGITLARNVLKGLAERDCFVAEIDLCDVSTDEEFTLRVLQAALQFRVGINPLSDYSLNDFLDNLSQPDIHAKIQDVVDVPYMLQLKDDSLALLDEAVNLLQRIPEQSDTRLVVWFHEWQEIARMNDGDLVLKRLRGMFQLQTHVTYAFTGSRDPYLLTTLFSDRKQAFYRFAVQLQFVPE